MGIYDLMPEKEALDLYNEIKHAANHILSGAARLKSLHAEILEKEDFIMNISPEEREHLSLLQNLSDSFLSLFPHAPAPVKIVESNPDIPESIFQLE